MVACPTALAASVACQVFLVSVVVRVRGWMVQRRVPGCSCVTAHMLIFFTKSKRFGPFMMKAQMRFSQKRPF